MKPCPTRLTCSLAATLVVACVLGLQGSTITVTPANPAVLVGQSVQLSAAGAVVPVNVSAGAFHTCVMYSDQSIRCTGLNNQGEIGNNSYIAVNEPQLAQVTVTPTTLLTGNEHTCTWISDGRMQCWGTNYTGQLGDGTIGGFAMVPQFVHDISNAAKGVTGGFHTCALLPDGTVRCWGRNQDGQIGNGDATTDVTLPTPVINMNGTVVDLYGGGYHTCAVMAPDRSVKCWGRNARGQVGDGTTTSPITEPHAVAGLSNVVKLALGGYHSCALMPDATVTCWGQSDYGQIGSPGPFSATPVTVPLTNVTQVAQGFWHTCAVTGDGVMRCWGRNDWGELGDRTLTPTSTPVVVQGITNPVQIAGGYGHTCALMQDSTVRCWGENDYGELGIGVTGAPQPAPVTMHLTGLTWTSSDTSVAAVNAAGLVTGVGGGTATITVTDSLGNTGSVDVTVRNLLTLAVIRQGDGSGTVTSAPAGIDCPAGACSAMFVADSAVTLTAAAGADSTFTGWTGCDSVSGATCTVTMSHARSVTAIFMLRRFTVSVTKSGIGKGTVTSAPAGISCGAACSSDYVINATVTLTAAPALGSIFLGWSGCDAVNSDNTCTVHVTANKSVSANFLGIPLF